MLAEDGASTVGFRHLDHLSIVGHVADEGFNRTGGGDPKIRKVERRAHGLALRQQVDSAFSDSRKERDQVSAITEELLAIGSVIVLEGASAKYPLRLDSLRRLTTHKKSPLPQWLLLSVRSATDDEPERATIWVADTYRDRFLKLFEDYLGRNTQKGEPANQELVANIARIRSGILDDLWTSDGLPPSGLCWWELWLDTNQSGSEALDHYLALNRIRSETRSTIWADRKIVWVEATWGELQGLPFTRVPIAEIRRPEFIDTIEDLPVAEQNLYVQDLADRIVPAEVDAVAVCHLDTGVHRAHRLLRDSLLESDQHTVIPGVSGDDISGHGTTMAGLALYGDSLDHLLVSNEQVILAHRLESVRIMAANSAPHDPKAAANTTAEAVSLPEIAAPGRRRVFCLPVSTPPDKAGEPTLWSAVVDALAAGAGVALDGDQMELLAKPDVDSARLVLVSAGNVAEYQADHLAESDTSTIEDPAQAWNVLTVGAFTELVGTTQDLGYRSWKPLAEAGGLSPHSRTSVMFDQRTWPVKPEICLEGGNVLTDGEGMFETKHPLFSLRSTGIGNDLALTSANATSAATAQASRLAALAMGRYPDYWPETIRGLLVHSAEWTSAMEKEVRAAETKLSRLGLLRRYGWGVPREETVLNSSNNAVTLVVQDQFVPFEGDEYRMPNLRMHTLPWPSKVLEELAGTEVRLRVTLSYFIEPSPARRGWRRRYSYPSHGLRFDIRGPLETQDQFVARVNHAAQSDEEGGSSRNGKEASKRWLIGSNQRHLGSLHQDEWRGAGAELASCDSVAVYPSGGWWKYSSRKDRVNRPVRYALLLSLKTGEQAVDLYTPIINKLAVPVPVEITAS